MAPPPPPPEHAQSADKKKCTFDARGLYMCAAFSPPAAAPGTISEHFLSAPPERFFSKSELKDPKSR